jgi:hypothetical protein
MKTDVAPVCCVMKSLSHSVACLPPPFLSSPILICCRRPTTIRPQQLPAHSATIDLRRRIHTAASSPPTSHLAPASPARLRAFSDFHLCTQIKLTSVYWTVLRMEKIRFLSQIPVAPRTFRVGSLYAIAARFLVQY